MTMLSLAHLYLCRRCTFAVVVPSLSLYLRWHCTFAGIIPSLSSYLRCRCTFAIIIPSLSLYLRCRCTFAVVVPSLSLYLRCHYTFAVIIPSLSLYLRCRCTVVAVCTSPHTPHRSTLPYPCSFPPYHTLVHTPNPAVLLPTTIPVIAALPPLLSVACNVPLTPTTLINRSPTTQPNRNTNKRNEPQPYHST